MDRHPTQVRQEQIKKAVLDIIFEEGLNRLTTRNVARRVGLSEGAIFRHFSTKIAILQAIMADVERNLMGALRTVARGGTPAQERFLTFLCTHVGYLRGNRGITILLFSEAAHHGDSGLKASLRGILAEMKALVMGIVADGVREGSWSAEVVPEDAATIYMGIPVSLNVEMILNPGGIDMDNFCRRMMALVVGGLVHGPADLLPQTVHEPRMTSYPSPADPLQQAEA